MGRFYKPEVEYSFRGPGMGVGNPLVELDCAWVKNADGDASCQILQICRL